MFGEKKHEEAERHYCSCGREMAYSGHRGHYCLKCDDEGEKKSSWW